jgi:hypothetical protein
MAPYSAAGVRPELIRSMRLRTLYEKFIGWRVLAGPFRGLRYVPEAVGSVHAPKLLGTYERELRPHIEALIASAPDLVINIGAAEGYYALGLARRLKGTRVLAFESDPRGRELAGRIALLNNLASQIEIRGFCTVADLAASLRGTERPAIVIDAEGGESELLDLKSVPDLARAIILVEVHDFISANIGDLLLRRFASSHRHEEIWTRPRTADDLPGFTRLTAFSPWRAQAVRSMDEQRPGAMRWFWFTPRTA